MPDVNTILSLAQVLGLPGALLLIFLYGFKSGWWHTSQEIRSIMRERDAEKDRRTRAETQVDTLLPAVNQLTDSVNRMSDLQAFRSNR